MLIILFCAMCFLARNSAQMENDLLDDYSIIPEGQSEVHGIDASDTAIAIATSKRLYLYHLTTPVQLIGKIDLYPVVIEGPGFLELKLLSDSTIGYCDTTIYCYCTFQPNKAACRSLSLKFDNVTSEIIMSASMAFVYPLLILRLVDDKDRAAILLFHVLETSDNEPMLVKKYAVDMKTRSNLKQVTIKGFVHGEFTYFVGTNSPSRNENSVESTKAAMILTRICNNDKTPHLNSRMDKHINCSYEAVGINAAHYDKKRDQLWLIVRSSNIEEMCRIDMAVVHEKLTQNWQICMTSREKEVIDVCERKRSSNSFIANCHIYNRRAHNWTRPCFNSNPSFSGGNCHVDQISTDDFMFGWLEDTQPLKGTGLLRFPVNGSTRSNIVPEPTYNKTFLSVQFKDYSAVEWMQTHHLSTISNVQVRRTKKLFPSMRHTIALSGDKLFMTNMNSVTSHHFSCDGFYKSCESIVSGSLTASVECVWCADENSQMAVSTQDPSCKNKIKNNCPAHTHRNISAALLRRRKTELVVTEIAKKPIVKLSPTSNEDTENGIDWIVLSVLVGVLIVLLVISGVILRELKRLVHPNSKSKRPTSLEHNSRPLLTSTGDVDECSTAQTIISASSISSSRFKYECGNLFKDIDNSIKIEISCLRLVEPIGEGNFGIVLLGNYTTPDGDIIKVACKILKAGQTGVKAFFDEGQTMMNLHHDRVIPFIGIALADDAGPIIVTKFMTNGNLLVYLQNNSDTIRGEQIQEFAMQIAEGMEYLHSKKFVHRDLAARNCMLDYKLQLKIGDFGLARPCNDENMYLSCRFPKVPFAWASMEALEFGTFTMKGDVWSYGVVLWELMTKGEKPFSNYTPNGLLQFLKQGKRLCRPHDCTDEFYTFIMIPCWDEDMQNRPSFNELIEILKDFS